MSYIIDNEKRVNSASNEIITNHSVNNNIGKLLNNDIKMDDMYNRMFKSKVVPYSKGMRYNIGDVVYFSMHSLVNDNVNFYILRNLVQDNPLEPKMEIVGGKFSFDNSGWENLNPYESLLENDISSYVYDRMCYHVNSIHSGDQTMHRFGSLVRGELDKKLLKQDMSNVSPNRDHILFPNTTYPLEQDDTIVNGFCRKWDCGILEYDIIFKLGYTGQMSSVYGYTYEVVKCNTLSIEDGKYVGSGYEGMFKYEDEKSLQRYTLNAKVMETNKDKYQNSYSSRINFPIPFKDNKYCIFNQNSVLQVQNNNSKGLVNGQNCVIYANKTKDHVDPMYIVYNQNPDKWYDSFLVQNRFHCKLVGRWN